MMNLDPTLKHLGTVLRRRLSEASAAEGPNRIAELLERLARPAPSDRSNDPPPPTPGSK